MIRLYSSSSSLRPKRWETKVNNSMEAVEEDQVGTPCPRSNLRPIRYSPRLWSRSSTSSNQDSENPKSKAREADYRHPYSLQEFQIEPILLPTHLAELKSALELEDLQWIMFRNRVDKFNQTFWETHSTRFEELEEEAQSQKDVTLNQSSDSSSSPIQQQKEQIDSKLDRFYSDWLIDHKLNFMKYNREWWALLPALIKGGWLAQLRNLKWKFACWRYSILSSKLVNYQ
ncbi:hypothetical protein MJO28_006927 [Puccinia striiformis f. sp. tritici]|uniref:Uncharacterized protein n=2 Tax=Puccinia striiformis f. sp. tritici TaxID=168172 RepID=A0ACC0ECF6_9BASI|nr:hypothetical protein MJO28_006927 [Puccinia striiformis f. sp. tritici]KAI7955494.1 hypothetical protein MJO29_006893 [Puccinia striiformis f. sp. tritici]KAI9630337.1 hypothetical protein KEM48_014063 [Puccinia striiformis f. sp. tritici PST-130]